MNKTTGTIIAVVLIVLTGIGGFFGGMQYQKSKAAGRAMMGGGGMGFYRGFGQGGMGGMGQNGGLVRGQILSVSGNTMTVKLRDGSSKIVLLSGSTNLMKLAKAAASDLNTGETVMIMGTTNSDGSVTAQNVSINPQMGKQGVAMTPIPTQTQGY
ncbi:MAG TPA: DUF5666 domain-containing protein [Patescibacteria group bacterium]|nr:DUF5666 domain-containing protein [Patescibacteria group bacterium]